MIRYWVLLLAALCTAIAVAYLPPPERMAAPYVNQLIRSDSFVLLPRENEVVWSAYTEYVSAAGRLRYARMYTRILELGDSIQQEAESRLKWDAGYQLTFAPEIPAALQDVIASQLDYSSRDARPATHGPPGVVAVVLDTVGDDVSDGWIRYYMPRFVYLLPQEPGQPCISLVTLGKTAANELATGLLRPGRILGPSPPALRGPCAFYSRFGKPGSGIESWLQQQEYQAALLPEWLAPPPFQGWASRLQRSGSLSYFGIQYPAFVSCASGDREACATAATQKPHMPQTVLHAERPRRVAIGWERYWYLLLPLGARSRSFLSDMVTNLGEEQFQQFWSSDEPVETAFLHAAGVTLEDWTMEWARQQIGVPRRGPAAPAASMALSLALAVASVGAGVAYATRRQVG